MRILPDLPTTELPEDLMFTGDIRNLSGEVYLVMGVTGLYTVNASTGFCTCPWAKFNPTLVCKHFRWLARWMKEESADGGTTP